MNIESQSYIEMIKWLMEQKTEPLLSLKMTKEDIMKVLEEPLILISLCHTQDVESLVNIVPESSLGKVYYTAMYLWILSNMESNRLLPKFETKKHDM